MRFSFTILFGLFLVHNFSAQLQNPGFDLWDTTFTSAYEQELINVFNIPAPVSGIIHAWGYGTQYGILNKGMPLPYISMPGYFFN